MNYRVYAEYLIGNESFQETMDVPAATAEEACQKVCKAILGMFKFTKVLKVVA